MIREISAAETVSTVAGSLINPSFAAAEGVALDHKGYLYVTDVEAREIKRVCLMGYTIDKTLPAGLNFDNTTGIISGTPTVVTPATNYTITAYNGSGNSSTIVSIATIGLIPQTITFVPFEQRYLGDADFDPMAISTNSNIPVVLASSNNAVATIVNGKIHITGIGNTIITASQTGDGTYSAAASVAQILDVLPKADATSSVIITPKNGPIILPLDNTGNINVTIDKVATVTGKANTPIKTTFSPASFNCSSVGQQNVTVTASQPSPVEFNGPTGIVADASGDIYIADQGNYCIKRIAPNGEVTTLAGSGSPGNTDGKGTAASFGKLGSMAIDSFGDLFVTDYDQHSIRKIAPDGTVTTFASGINVGGIVLDRYNNVYVSTQVSIKKITPDGATSYFAGINASGDYDATGLDARFSFINGLAIDEKGDIYALDYGNAKIRKISPAAVVTTIYSFTQFEPFGSINVDASGNVFVAYEDQVWELPLGGNAINFVGGYFLDQGFKDGVGAAAEFNDLTGMTIDPSGNLYVSDFNNNAIRKITPGGVVTTIAGGIQGNVNGNINSGTPTTAQIPVTVQSSLAITSTYPDVVIPANSSCPITLPDYTKTASATDNCSNNIKFTQSPLAGTVLSSNTPVTVTITATDDLNAKSSVNFKVTADNNAPTPSLSISGPAVACAGTALTFTAVPANVIASTYQWQVNGTNAGDNSPSFTTSTLNNNDVVSCNILTGQSCLTPVTSNPLSITINPLITPIVNIQADNLAPCAGMPVTFTATLNNGIVNPAYQWMVNGINTGTNSATFVTTTLIKTDIVQCKVTNNSSCPTSAISNQVAGIDQVAYVTPSIKIQSSSTGAICSGTLITFTATAINGGNNSTYQWRVNGVNAGTNSPAFSSNSFADGDIVNCVLTNNGGQCITASQATSNNVEISITPPSILVPTVTITPDNYDGCNGMSLTYTATTTNAGSSPTYQWQVNGQDAGTNTATFISSTLNTGDKITCKITSSVACSVATATSNTASLTADAYTTNSVSITSTAVNNIISPDQPVTFTATTAYTTSGTITVAYQWQVNNINVGDNSPVFTTSSLINHDVVACIIITTGKCVASPVISSNPIEMIVFTPVIIVNTFTPNGDGVNDTWDIPSLAAYTGCTINIFNRYGILVYNSVGYAKSWDGTVEGKPLPSGTYYYVIDLKNGKKPLSGPVTILR
ncbi:Serine/threonine-protein kinase PknD [Mucilaginibacter gotjawali]|uniref:Serine/threonine-protein kinase PknD n=1 Tax=Mucilaginibacter gotjawali TaxID=1550579 RepID=A0A110B299_9SPHI|nr:gliding motility-associated C-terminal domain-containing protein [Mucilaginibacter gotjawali]BAU53441.1 Serine/threonine-protein kinase PknD [Mucilaginibacter gotjawali]